MGSKMSSLSCAKCSSQSKSEKFKRRGHRKSFTNRFNFEESMYETIAPPIVYMSRGGRRNEQQIRIEPVRTFSQRSMRPTLPPLNKGTTADAASQYEQRRSVATAASDPTFFACTSTASKERFAIDAQNATETKPTGFQCVSNSVEILDCPEMSTISLRSAPISIVASSRCDSVARDTMYDAPHATSGHQHEQQQLYDEMSVPGPVTHNDATMATLDAPPNSVNSQFLSGITPLESLREHPEYSDASDDSVFLGNDQQLPVEGYLQCPPEYLAQFEGGQLLNNNSLIPCTVVDNDRLLPGDVSDGPGFDSDFGASAGVEMRIVSSDYSSMNVTHFQKKRGDGPLPGSMNTRGQSTRGKNKRRPSPRINLAASLNQADASKTSGKPPFLLQPLAHHPSLMRRSPRRRPATIAGPERSALHITMEWDPYDFDYGSTHWMEYFIPGIAYPNQPLLRNEQHWV